MSEILERVMKAIADKQDLSWLYDEQCCALCDPKKLAATREKLTATARAALEAMREPDHAMFLAGRELALSGSKDDLMNRDSVKQRWRVMIDAALGKVDA